MRMASNDMGPEHLDLLDGFASIPSQMVGLLGLGPINCDLCLGLLRPPRGGRHDELRLPGRHLGITGGWIIQFFVTFRSSRLPGTIGESALHSAASLNSPWALPRARLLDSDASGTWVSWVETSEVSRCLWTIWAHPLWLWIPASGN